MTTTQDRLDDQRVVAAHGCCVVEAPNIPADQAGADTHRRHVGGDPDIRSGQNPTEAHGAGAVADLTPRPARVRPASIAVAPGGDSDGSDQTCADTHRHGVAASTSPVPAESLAATKRRPPGPGTPVPDPATAGVAPIAVSPVRAPNSLDGHAASDTQMAVAVEGPNSGDQLLDDAQTRRVAAPTPPAPAMEASATSVAAPVLADLDGRPAAIPAPMPIVLTPLADPVLQLAADMLDDFERVRIANENRLRQLTRDETDADGIRRGLGIPADHPMIAATAKLVEAGAALEHDAELNLRRMLRRHPLGPWVKRTIGIGEKQGARLLAPIGDPYIRPRITRADGTVEESRPRTVSELWAYCGYHVLPAGQAPGDTQSSRASGDQAGSHPDQVVRDARMITAGVAAARRRGTRANWSATAKMRAYLCAESCMKNRSSPYREIYEAGREKYAEAVHAVECVRCGPAGKPAPVGSPLSDGHKHARALRLASKAILRDLWREAGRLHGADTSLPPGADPPNSDAP
jgi:hypothetical protein